tara:strand:+ start:1044 stop:1277 length:234 start_codon:yes stop_codon:yes gene_type:complete
MLVLTSKTGSDILLGEEGFQVGEHLIKLSVLSIKGKKVKIGIDAPDGIEILRSELLQERDNANRNGNTTTDVPGCVS